MASFPFRQRETSGIMILTSSRIPRSSQFDLKTIPFLSSSQQLILAVQKGRLVPRRKSP